MILKNKIKMRNIVFLVILGICIGELIVLPIIIDGQRNSEDSELNTEVINDLYVRKVFLRKKGIFSDVGDTHWFQVALKQDVEYVARMKFTAALGGTFIISLTGVLTNTVNFEVLSNPVTNYLLEAIYIADGTTTGVLQITYSTPAIHQEFPTYTLYFNKTGFAGWWWIALSGIGALAVLAFIFTFMIIGMISVSKRKKKGKRRRRK
jgi:hypothetical protein